MAATTAAHPPLAVQRVKLESILIATDFSDAAARAIPCVRTLAQQYGAKIFVCHILDPLIRPAEPPAIDMPRTSAEFKLGEWSEKHGLSQPEYEPIFISGEPPDAVSKIIREKRIDLVVVGTQALEGVGRVLWGSVAEEIFREVEVPVLVVGPAVRPRRRSHLQIKHILYASDLSACSAAAAPYVASIAEEFGAEVTLLHLEPNQPTSPAKRQKIRRSLQRRLQALLPESEAAHTREAIVEFGDPAQGILEFAGSETADLIVLGVRQGGSLSRAATHTPWTIAHKIIARAPCPVLTVRGTS